MNIKVKKILEDIIDNAYPDVSDISRNKYKRFYLEIIPKELKSKSGTYFLDKKKIEIYNLSHDSKTIVKTCIHELAHHIDFCNRGTSDHQMEFYECYRALLYAAMNMRIITPEQLKNDFLHADGKKVKKIVDEWKPAYVSYKSDTFIFRAIGAYEFRYMLKGRGYKWNSMEETWDKECTGEECNTEEGFLRETGITYKKVSASDFNIEAIGYLVCEKDSYLYKDALKEHGFHFHSEGRHKYWRKKVPMPEMKAEIERLHSDGRLAQAEFATKNK